MTIKDLSAQTGYSVGTISRVLNNQPNVSPKAREIILRAADQCGFQLNANAKQLKQQQSNSILVMVKGTHNELFESLMEHIQAHVAATSYSLIVDYTDESQNEVLRALQLCREKKPRGILFLGGNREHFLADFDKITMPSVLLTCDASSLPFANLSSVTSDDVLAGKTAIEHLIGLGHRKIAIVGGPRVHSSMTHERYRGCLDAFQAHGVDFDGELDYESVRFSFDWGYQAAKQLLEKNRGYTAIFAMADVLAIGAIRALRDAGLRVPEDVSVVGLDGLAIGEYMVPRLTTISQNVEELAEQGFRMLLNQVEKNLPARYEILPVSLVVRESTREFTE